MGWKPIGDEDKLRPPLRPKDASGYGDQGRPIRLLTNHFPVTVKNINQTLVHYDVKISSKFGDSFPKWKKRQIFERLKDQYPKVFKDRAFAFDSETNAYSIGLIPQLASSKSYKVLVNFANLSEISLVELTPAKAAELAAPISLAQASQPAPVVDDDAQQKGAKKKKKKKAGGIEDPGSRYEYIVTIEKVQEANLKDLMQSIKYASTRDILKPSFQMIEVLFRHYRSMKFLQIGRNNFFSLNEEFARNYDLGTGKIGMTGFFASLRPAAWKDGSLLLNVDKAHAAFYKPQKVLDYLKEIHSISEQDLHYPLDSRVLFRLKKEISQIKIRVNHSHIKRTYKVNSVTSRGADKLTFPLERDGKSTEISVAKYFKEQYNLSLRYPKLNCLHVGNVNKSVYIPIEVCEIEKGQKVTKKLSDKETALFIKSTAIPPAERLQSIMNAVRTNNFNADPNLQALNFTIADQPLQTNGRVLHPPSLTMDRDQFKPRDGNWDVRNKKFHNPAPLNSWVIINYDFRTHNDKIERFFKELIKMGREKGMNIENYSQIINGTEAAKDFRNLKHKYQKIDLICCILSGGPPGKKQYNAIKYAGDREHCIVSQCVAGLNVLKCAPPTISNILLKINAKLDGTNNILTPKQLITFKEPVMIMGADVNHPPSKGDKSMPSLAAVVGSFDMHATKYQSEVRSQGHRVEIIDDLTEITKSLLKNFYRQTRQKPRRIIMFRDGVSESQFMEVLAKEMQKMRAACTLIQKDYTPGITFVCVQKRHHTRLFCQDERKDGVGKTRNVPPGTVVDRDVTHPSEIDFYLCSHQGIQGTSRPTHYHVLWDDNDLPMNELQALTYSLCHVYTRCSKSVSIPAPAYYAHLAAYRAKVHVADLFDEDSSNSSMSEGQFAVNRSKIEASTRISGSDAISTKLYYV